ncbi:MAG: hypothetical protein WCX64_03680 [Candidatus Micrarchaeia archaeon]|jgi:hypothetical protein
MQPPKTPELPKPNGKKGIVNLSIKYDVFTEKHPERDSQLVMMRVKPLNGENSAEGIAGHLVGKIQVNSLSERMLKEFKREGLEIVPCDEAGNGFIYRPINNKAEVTLYEKVLKSRKEKIEDTLAAVKKEYPDKPSRSKEHSERMFQ